MVPAQKLVKKEDKTRDPINRATPRITHNVTSFRWFLVVKKKYLYNANFAQKSLFLATF